MATGPSTGVSLSLFCKMHLSDHVITRADRADNYVKMLSVSSHSPGTASVTTSASTPPAYHFTPKVCTRHQHHRACLYRNVFNRRASTPQTSCQSSMPPESALSHDTEF